MTADTAKTLPPLEVAGRLGRLRSALREVAEGNKEGNGEASRAIEGLLVTNPVNIRWLTGFSGSAGMLLVSATRALLTTDGRYRSQSAEQLAAAGLGGEVEVEVGGVAAQREAVVGVAAGTEVLGLEAAHVTWSAQRVWADLLPAVHLAPTTGVVERLRAVKDPGELARMARAASIADDALGEVLPLLEAAARPGRAITEARFAAALDHAMREGGAEERAFETIVAAGPDSAKPHARPTERPIGAGDPVVVDFGAVFDGYRSDMTRTFWVGGEPTGEMVRVFEVVGAAQRAGVESVRAGIAAGEVDEVCREMISAAGWKERFEHGTGHGVGLDIHEAPSVAPGSTAILEPGTVVTVEPGVYLPGVGGVRIEDTLVVTDQGCRSLTTFPKEVAL